MTEHIGNYGYITPAIYGVAAPAATPPAPAPDMPDAGHHHGVAPSNRDEPSSSAVIQVQRAYDEIDGALAITMSVRDRLILQRLRHDIYAALFQLRLPTIIGLHVPVVPPSVVTTSQLRDFAAPGSKIRPSFGSSELRVERTLGHATTYEDARRRLSSIESPAGKLAVAVEIVAGGRVTYEIVEVDRSSYYETSDAGRYGYHTSRDGVRASLRVVGSNEPLVGGGRRPNG